MAAESLLGSWNDTPARREIVDFVQSVSTEGSAGFAAPQERVAVFDNDGTRWSEKPIPIQLDFTLFRMACPAGSRRWSSCCATWRRTALPPTSRRAVTTTSCARSRTPSTESPRSG